MEERGPHRSQNLSGATRSVPVSGAAGHNGAASTSVSTSAPVSAPAADVATPTKEASVEFNLMLRGLLHELRNPLSSILTAANLVDDTARESSEVSEETTMLLGVIKKESLRLNRILTEFSNFIKLPAPQPTSFDFVQLTRDVTSQLQDENVIAAGVSIVDELPAEYFVWADQSQMRMALHHLLRNSGEAMPENGRLHLTLREQPDKAVICLGDSGQGFSEESHARAFQPFYSTKLHSTGLGLSTARAIIEAAGGRLWIENARPPADESTPEGESTPNTQSTPATPQRDAKTGTDEALSTVRLCVELPRRA